MLSDSSWLVAAVRYSLAFKVMLDHILALQKIASVFDGFVSYNDSAHIYLQYMQVIVYV